MNKFTSEVTNEDCMVGMARYPDKYFDLAIVDPPYGLDLANMNMGAGKSKKASKIQNRKWKPKNWDKETPTNEYFKKLFCVSKNQIIWGGNYFDLAPCKITLFGIKKYQKGYHLQIVKWLGLLLIKHRKFLDIQLI